MGCRTSSEVRLSEAALLNNRRALVELVELCRGNRRSNQGRRCMVLTGLDCVQNGLNLCIVEPGRVTFRSSMSGASTDDIYLHIYIHILVFIYLFVCSVEVGPGPGVAHSRSCFIAFLRNALVSLSWAQIFRRAGVPGSRVPPSARRSPLRPRICRGALPQGVLSEMCSSAPHSV